MGDYQYKPLAPGQIRLLNLHAGGRDQPLRADIIHLTLTNPEYVRPKKGLWGSLKYEKPYEAISYHWGSSLSTPYQVALDNGSVVPITTALHGVLRRVVLPNEDRLLWVDAICINQVDTNSKEKEEQIKVMPDIYRIAKRVLVYLGPESDNTSLAIDLIGTIAKYSEYLDPHLNSAGHGGFELAEKRGMNLPPPDDPSWEALRAFWRRPWFRRVWVIQEFVYATEIVIICGDQEIDWKKLYFCSRVYPHHRRLVFRGFPGGLADLEPYQLALDGAMGLHTIADLRVRARGFMSREYIVWSITRDEDAPATELLRSGMRSDVAPLRRDREGLDEFERTWGWKMLSNVASGNVFFGERPDLFNLTRSVSTFLSTKPVDKLYALRSLFEGGDDFPAVYPEGADDELTLTTGLVNFTLALLRRGRGAEVIASAGLRTPTSLVPPGIPTWVPDWVSYLDYNDRRVPFGMLTAGAKPDPNGVEGEAGAQNDDFVVYKAALDTTFAWDMNQDLNKLTVAGIRADVVDQLFVGQLVMNPVVYEALLRQLVPQYPTGESHEEVIFRTLVGNRTLDGQRLTPEHFLEYVRMRRDLNARFGLWAVLTAVYLLVATAVVVGLMRLVSVIWYCIVLAGLAYTQHLSPVQGILALVGVLVVRHVTVFLTMVVVMLAWWHFIKSGHSFVVNEVQTIARDVIVAADPNDEGPVYWARYQQALHKTAGRYHMGTTARGFVGLFPLYTKPGDVVAIVAGCDAPLILRGHEDAYAIVGDAYIHGIMDGEALMAFGVPPESLPLI